MYLEDNDFAKALFDGITIDTLPPSPSSPELCDRCSNIDLDHPLSLSELQHTAKRCDLCRMLSQHFKSREGSNQNEIRLLDLLDRPSGLKMCAYPGS
jgi:hypothetical protein